MNPPKNNTRKNSSGIIHLIPLVLVGAVIMAALIWSTKNKPPETGDTSPGAVDGTTTENLQNSGDAGDIENQLNGFISEMEKAESEMEEIEKDEEFISQKSDEVRLETDDDKVIINVKTRDSSGKEIEKEEEASEAAYLTTPKLKVKNGEVRLKSEDGIVSLVQEQNGTENSASTRLPISLNSNDNTVTVTTGEKTVTIDQFPSDVMEVLSKNLDKVDSLELKSADSQSESEIAYHAKGIDNVKFLGLIKVNAPVEADVNVKDASVTLTEKPWYLKYFEFLFTGI